MNKELCEKLSQINNEDFIWLIYIGIIFLSWYSNSLERDYFINKNIKSREEYREILIFIFSVLNVVYFYFLNNSITSLRELKKCVNKKKKELNYLSFLASLFISISGIILLYIAINDHDMNVEIAFN